jgi:dienelactone hydrolase
VIVMRRGHGSSGGRFAADQGCSSHPQYFDAGEESAKDLRAAIAYLSSLPEVDASRIISVGISTGGFATVALTADPPPGLVAGISFAGGRGSDKPDDVCHPGDLVRAFADFGLKSRVPMLWVYAENDHFFGPQISEQFYRAFTKSGGRVSFIRAAAFRKEGHGLFSHAGAPIWTPLVDDFLSAQHLKLRDSLLALPVPPDVSPPSQLSSSGQEAFRYFLTLPGEKAFALSSSGHYGYVFGRRTAKEAIKNAMERCDDDLPKGEHCEVVHSDDDPPGTYPSD